MIRSSYAAAARLGVAVLLSAFASAAFATSASAAVQDIASSGPLTHIYASDSLNCQIARAGDANFQFFSPSNTRGSCGTFIWAGGATSYNSTYGYGTPYTLISQTPVSGSGSASDPLMVTTVVDLGTTGLRATQTDLYVVGDESYRSRITLSNSTSSPVDAVIYHAADCFLQTSDESYGYYDADSKGSYCSLSPNNSPTNRIEGFAPVESGSHYMQGGYSEVFAAMNGDDFPDTCRCSEYIDSGTGISWAVTVPAGGSVTRNLISGFSPVGTAIDVPPVAVDDEITIGEDAGQTSLGLLANDTDTDGGEKKITSTTPGAGMNGALSLATDGSDVTYTPPANYCNTQSGGAPETFTYTLNGGDTAMVNVNVTCANDAPVASDDALTVDEDQTGTVLTGGATSVLANDNDVDGDALTAAVVDEPLHGTLTLNANGTFSYAPAANYSGPDSFTYRANDGTVGSTLVAEVSITVTPVNDAPTASDDALVTNEDEAASTLTGGATSVLANDSDTEGDSLTAAVASDPAHGTLTLNANGTFSYTPEPNYSGSDSFTYKSNDGTVDSAAATVTITVNAVDDDPVAVDDDVTIDEDAGATTFDVLDNDTDIDGGPLFVDTVSDASHGDVAVAPGRGGGVTYTPDADYCNTQTGGVPDTFTYMLNGGAEATVSVTVKCVDGPTTTTVASSKNPAVVGDAVTFTAAVAADAGGAAGGTVTFKDGSVVLGTTTLGGDGKATLTKSDLAVGDHAVTVEYAGTNDLRPSTGTLTQKVGAVPAPPATPSGPTEPTTPVTPVTPVAKTHIAISHRSVPRSGAYVKLAIKCRAAAGRRCKGSLLLDPTSGTSRMAAATAKARYGVVEFDVAAGQSMAVKLKATPQLMKALARRRKVIAKATAVFAGRDGDQVTVERKLTIIEPRAKK